MRRVLVLSFVSAFLIAAAPPDVQMTAANPAAATALQHPRVAAALQERMRMHTGLVAGDADAFGSGFALDAVVNGPTNSVVTAADATQRSRAGALNYKYMHTSVEYAAPRREDEVVFMGEETYEFQAGMPQAGKTLRRRFTDLYRQVDGRWLLSLRQATIIHHGGAASRAAMSHTPVPGVCQDDAEANRGKIGCYLNVALEVGRLPPAVYWHIDEYSDAASAKRDSTPTSAVVSAHGRTFLQTVSGDRAWRPRAGRRLASVGPFPAEQGVNLTARLMEATTPPGMTTRPHRHSGPEAWYMIEGAQCLETPLGATIVPQGGSTWIAEGPPMQLSASGSQMRRSLVLVLHPSGEPWMTLAQDWTPRGLCNRAPSTAAPAE